jgi:hypothetical protein
MDDRYVTLSRPYSVLAWNEGVQEHVMSFWRGRGFEFTQTKGDILTGHRGSLEANMYCISADKLLAELTIERVSPVEIRCTMCVNTIYQYIVEWNFFTWLLEMDTFESFLRHNDRREAEWQEFRRHCLGAYIFHLITLGILGRNVPDQWKQRLRHPRE